METALVRIMLMENTSVKTTVVETTLVETALIEKHVSRGLPESLIRGKSCSLSSLSWIFASPPCYCNEKGGKSC